MPCWGQRSHCVHWLSGGRLVAPGAVPVPGPGSGPRPWGPCARRGAVAGGVCGTGLQRADEKRNRCSPAAYPSASLPGPSTGGLSRQLSLWSFGVLCAAFLSLLAPPGLLEERACGQEARFGRQGQSGAVTDSALCCWKQQTPRVHTHTHTHARAHMALARTVVYPCLRGRLPRITATRWASRSWRTGDWRRAAGRWCRTSSSRTRYGDKAPMAVPPPSCPTVTGRCWMRADAAQRHLQH